MSRKPVAEKWTCSYLANETDADFRNLHLKQVNLVEYKIKTTFLIKFIF